MGNSKVCESEDDSDDELDPNEFANLINEYTSVIKREKGKVKVLESTHAKLELAHSDLLGKYNDLLKKHNESLVLAKQVEGGAARGWKCGEREGRLGEGGEL